MKRIVPIVLYCGWLLFSPPPQPKPNSDTPNIYAPLSKWYLEGGFDTAKDCNEEKLFRWRAAKEVNDTISSKIFAGAVCVPSESIGFKFQ